MPRVELDALKILPVYQHSLQQRFGKYTVTCVSLAQVTESVSLQSPEERDSSLPVRQILMALSREFSTFTAKQSVLLHISGGI